MAELPALLWREQREAGAAAEEGAGVGGVEVGDACLRGRMYTSIVHDGGLYVIIPYFGPPI